MLKALLLVLGFSTTQVCVHAMVAGVDFGSEFFKISLVKPGTPFEIVTNIHSKRKTETLVAFDGEDRLYGADALNVGVRRPQMAYAQTRRLLGAQLLANPSPSVVSLTTHEYHPYELVQNVTRGSIGLVHNNDPENVFHAEELVAMIFSHARDITNAFAEGVIKDWVITVPCFFAQAQRQAILDAAEITGVRVLSLIEENTAAALQFGIDNTYNERYRVLYYNLGSASLQVSVVEYNSVVVPDGFKKNKTVGSFDVLAKTWDQSLGGAAFDLRLAEHLADVANDKLQLTEDIRLNPKAMAKIRAQAKKTKIVLSANEQIPIVMQSLVNDRDFTTTVTRKQFEDLCLDLFDKVLPPIELALTKSGITSEQIDAIEIIGGGVRMPRIQSQLKNFFNKDLSVHLNGDEAMALGAAFRAANISNAFRVRTVGMNDISSFAVGVRLVDLHHETVGETLETSTDEEPPTQWVKRAALFKENNRLNVRKSVSFHHNKDISCTFRYDTPSQLPPGVDSIISRFNVTGIEAFVQEMQAKQLPGMPKVSLSFFLDASGMVSIAKAEVSLEEEIPAVPEVVDEKSSGENSTEEGKENSTEEDKENSTEEDKEKDISTEDKEKKKKKETEPTIKVHRKSLFVVTSADVHEAGMAILPMTIAEKKESLALLADMQKRDDIRVANAAAKNDLESYVYKARDTLEQSREKLLDAQVATSAAMDALSAEINDAEDWLYDEGENVEAAMYTARLRSMQKQLDGMLFRLNESSKRPAAVKRVVTYAATTRALMEEWEEAKPQVKEEEKKEVLAMLESLEKWVAEKQELQAELAANESPAFTSMEVLTKLKDVKRYVSVLSKRPKPAPPVVETNDTASEEEKAATPEGEKVEGEENKPTKEEKTPTETPIEKDEKATEEPINHDSL